MSVVGVLSGPNALAAFDLGVLSEKSVGLLTDPAGEASASARGGGSGAAGCLPLPVMDVVGDGTAPIPVVDARPLGMVAAALGVARPVLE